MSHKQALGEGLCPVDDCSRTVASERLMCAPHWFMVPKELRDEVWAAWRLRCDASTDRRMERYAAARDRHEHAKAAAIQAVNDKVNPHVP